MEATNISFDPATRALTVTIDPADSSPEEQALVTIAYVLLMLYPPPDQNKAAHAIRKVGNALGFEFVFPDGDGQSVDSVTVSAQTKAPA